MSKLTKKDIVDFATNGSVIIMYVFTKEKAKTNHCKSQQATDHSCRINRDAPIDFLKSINIMPATPVQPQWLDYTKDFQRKQLVIQNCLYVQNKDNEIFRLRYRFDMGTTTVKLLSIASQYLQFLGTDINDCRRCEQTIL